MDRLVRWATEACAEFATVAAATRARPGVRRGIRDGLSLVGFGIVALLFLLPNGADTRSYWYFNLADPYRQAIGNLDATVAFRYGPPVAILLAPLHALPWLLFVRLWLLVNVTVLFWLGRTWALALAALYPIAFELSIGNVHLLLAAAIVLGFRYPAAWSFLLLTKVTPGIGLLWFAVRREWRSLGVALGATLLIAGVSFVLVPHLWPQWVSMLLSDAGASPRPTTVQLAIPFIVRVPVCIALIVWGAKTDRAWTVPVAAWLALPMLWWNSPAMLLALLPMARAGRLATSRVSVSEEGVPRVAFGRFAAR